MTDNNNLQHWIAVAGIQEPEPEINYVDPARFLSGQWCERIQRHVGESDISASYSADCIGMGQPVRKPFKWRGMLLVNTGGWSRGANRLIKAYRLIHPSQFDGEPTTYTEVAANGDIARANPMGFYHGMEVAHAGESRILCGKPFLFAPGRAEQLSLF